MDNKQEPNFDDWVRLFNEDPEKFEQLRQEMIQQIIDDSPDTGKKRLQGLQWQIDQHRDNSNNPMSSCIKISSMMWDTVLGEEGLIENIEKLANPSDQSIPVKNTAAAADILPFPSSNRAENGDPDD